MGSQSLGLDVLRIAIQRRELLSRLEGESVDKRTLVDSLEQSRSTVDRAVRELEGLRVVQREEEGYRLTAAGRLVLEQYRRSVGAFDSIGEASALLADVPPDAPMSTALLDGADVAEPPPHAPAEPLQDVADLVASAERVRAVMAADRSQQLHSELYSRAFGGGLDGELILTEPLAGFIRDAFPSEPRDPGDGFDLFTLESIPYELVLVETATESRVFVFVLDDTTAIRGTIRNDTDAAVEWGETAYRQFRAAATELPPLE